MRIEIDQSGKIEQLNTTTVVACANGESCVLSMSVAEKRLLFIRLRTSVVAKNDRLAVIFAVLVFFLLRTLEPLPTNILIDEEYTGKDALAYETLEKLLLRQTKGKWRGVIRIGRIGKHSPAHILAWTSHRKSKKTRKIMKVVTADIMRWWK